MNAVTMSVATKILQVLGGEEDLSTYDSISRLRGADTFRPIENPLYQKSNFVLGNDLHSLVRQEMDNFDITTSMGRIYMEAQLMSYPEFSQVTHK